MLEDRITISQAALGDFIERVVTEQSEPDAEVGFGAAGDDLADRLNAPPDHDFLLHLQALSEQGMLTRHGQRIRLVLLRLLPAAAAERTVERRFRPAEHRNDSVLDAPGQPSRNHRLDLSGGRGTLVAAAAFGFLLAGQVGTGRPFRSDGHLGMLHLCVIIKHYNLELHVYNIIQIDYNA